LPLSDRDLRDVKGLYKKARAGEIPEFTGISRDVKGLYKKARAGEIPEFTGISSPYEEPLDPELVLDTGNTSLDVCRQQVLSLLVKRGVITEAGTSAVSS
jgi:adenylylsulfate kinase-like enzyme